MMASIVRMPLALNNRPLSQDPFPPNSSKNHTIGPLHVLPPGGLTLLVAGHVRVAPGTRAHRHEFSATCPSSCIRNFALDGSARARALCDGSRLVFGFEPFRHGGRGHDPSRASAGFVPRGVNRCRGEVRGPPAMARRPPCCAAASSGCSWRPRTRRGPPKTVAAREARMQTDDDGQRSK
jgi:hypothetical protein